MMLYKYVPFETGAKILRTNTIGFSQPIHFNDPFDLPAYPYAAGDDLGSPLIREAQARHLLDKFERELSWAELTGILCLTRTPTNPLMWAHYAQGHAGIVLGIDAVLAGMTDESRNLIPAQYGSVVYVSGRSEEPFITVPQSVMTIGTTHHFLHDQYERLQRLFLHKPLHWAYEEEVRVLKSVEGIAPPGGENRSGKFNIVNTGDNRPIYLYTLPAGSIREIVFGYRAHDEACEALFNEVRDRHNFIAYECTLRPANFSVQRMKYTPLSASMAVPESSFEER